MKAPDRISDFTSDRTRTRFHTAYQRALPRLWPTAPRPRTVTTRYGEVVAYRFGAAHGTPVVLLPGAGGNALGWARYIPRLAAAHPVVALDLVGEPGAARQTAPIGTDRDAAACLAEALTALDAERAHLVGLSYGGWLALRHELHFPGRAASLTLLDPAGFGAVTGRFLLWVTAGGLASLTPRPVRRRLAGLLANATLREDALMGLIRASLAFRRRLPVAVPLTDDELASIATPTLLILGERSQMYDAASVAERVRRVMPAARVEIVPRAGHDLPVHSPELVADRIDAFLRGASGPRR
ncbi:alpha/beta fold hydrolase [Micromonospora globbae]|jgi:pimeloyl-ACP methyl ester carboxylesterase|uniref:Alpha/beta fold hydrolase n=1 Tax=Micromonospora globbae TaxID=1894969 RepID=A0A420F7Q2_9ACTN|nr:alpha/beta fold hydrolase [Micromonospora globbae]RKF28968.1 alpha/beta fold hydrolase [Micromonospora globbae]WTF83692.1 alpha/beta fold hydrolase [Micromonospora globbae]